MLPDTPSGENYNVWFGPANKPLYQPKYDTVQSYVYFYDRPYKVPEVVGGPGDDEEKKEEHA